MNCLPAQIDTQLFLWIGNDRGYKIGREVIGADDGARCLMQELHCGTLTWVPRGCLTEYNLSAEDKLTKDDLKERELYRICTGELPNEL